MGMLTGFSNVVTDCQLLLQHKEYRFITGVLPPPPLLRKVLSGVTPNQPPQTYLPGLGGVSHFENLAQKHRAGFEPGLLDVKSIASVEKPLRLRASAVNAVS